MRNDLIPSDSNNSVKCVGLTPMFMVFRKQIHNIDRRLLLYYVEIASGGVQCLFFACQL